MIDEPTTGRTGGSPVPYRPPGTSSARGIDGGPRQFTKVVRHERHANAVGAQINHFGRSARSQLRLKPMDGKLQGGEHLVERRFPLGVEDPRREHPAIRPARGQQLKQLARAQGGAAGGVKVTMDRGEEQAHGAPGGKPKMGSLDGVGCGRTNPLRSRSCPQEETTFRRHSQDSGDLVVN